jgi:hypothetical protein
MHKCTSFTIILAESCVNLSIFVRFSQFSVLRTISEIAAITLLICWSIGVIVFCFLCCGGLTCIYRCKIFCLTFLLIGFYKFYRFSFNGFLIVHYIMVGLDIALQFLRLSALLLNSRGYYFFGVCTHNNLSDFLTHNISSANCLPVLLFGRVSCLVVSLFQIVDANIFQTFGKLQENFFQTINKLLTNVKIVHSQKFLVIHKEIGK